jgi:putative tryptophan/tyrosine transport system substrate-binding protein
MRRRQFVAGLGAAAWPLVARAQQSERVRRVGLLTGLDQSYQAFAAAFREGLSKLGWVEGHNLTTELRFGAANADAIRVYAAELVGLAPDVIVTTTVPATRAVQQQTRTIPIVFVAVGDPVDNEIVKNIARPEANATGVTNLFASFGGKWMALLKEAAPRVERVALVYNPQFEFSFGSLFPSIEGAARALDIQTVRIPYRNAGDIVGAIDAFAAAPNGGATLLPPPPPPVSREAFYRLAIQYRLPTISPTASEGSLVAYGPNVVDLYGHASSYVDRILRGAKVNELPVAFPTRFQLVINLKTAKALGLTIPETLLATADEVIQ